MSFALTTDQVRAQTKTVTRRLGWAWLEVGTLLQPVVKAQGLKKGAHVQTIGGPIRVVGVRRERLDALLDMTHESHWRDVLREGFPELNEEEFVEMFCRHNGCAPDAEVTRIEFEYVRRSVKS